MTVIPGSLDYLYYNGILDHIPYEAYELSPIGSSSGMRMPPVGNGRPAYGNMGMGMGMPNQGMNNYYNPNMGMKGQIYGNYGDSFGSMYGYGQMGGMQPQMQMYSGNYGGGIGNYGNYNAVSYHPGYMHNSYNQFNTGNVDNFRESLIAEAKDAKKGEVLSSNPIVKGLIAAAVIIATPILLIRSLKKAPVKTASNRSFWEKINPKNWGKKKTTPPPENKNFWDKINPKNWAPKLWDKINPKNWGKKKSTPPPPPPKGGNFWDKINPKNWAPKLWDKINPKNWGKKGKP